MDILTSPRNHQDVTIAPETGQKSATNQDSSALTSDFETFLRMLTVQLQNQDPLNPVEASDYAVQLATFSGVEQQVKTNELLSKLGNQMQLVSLGQFAGWVGMEARHGGPAHFSGTPIDVHAKPPGGSDRAELVIRNGSNDIIDRIGIPATEGTVTWNGLAASGQTLPSGPYHFFVEGFSGQLSTGIVPAQSYSLITEARNEPDGPVLGVSGGVVLDPSDVTGVRKP